MIDLSSQEKLKTRVLDMLKKVSLTSYGYAY
jgi:hypothetical protein